MSRYNNDFGGSNDSNDSNYEDDVELKLKEYAAIRCEGERVNAFSGNWGDMFIAGFQNTSVIDGIVFQREDKPMTWKVFPAGKFANLNPEDGLVYENYDEDTGEYSGQLTAEEILNEPKVAGFFENFGGDDYEYQPVGVVIEAAEDVALNSDIIGEGTPGPMTEEMATQAREDIEIPVGRTSMLLKNTSWVRTLAKKLTRSGHGIINDNGVDDPDENPKYADFDWLTTLDPELRPELEGRTMELWVTEETREYDDGEQTYSTPNLRDVKTGNWVTIENGVQSNDDDGEPTNHEAGQQAAQDHDEPAANPDPEPDQAATDGGTATADSGSTGDPSSGESTTDSDTSNDSSNDTSSSSGLPGDVPDVLDDLLDYFARTQGEASPDEIREFAANEVENPDDVDWEAAAAEVSNRA